MTPAEKRLAEILRRPSFKGASLEDVLDLADALGARLTITVKANGEGAPDDIVNK